MRATSKTLRGHTCIRTLITAVAGLLLVLGGNGSWASGGVNPTVSDSSNGDTAGDTYAHTNCDATCYSDPNRDSYTYSFAYTDSKSLAKCEPNGYPQSNA